MQYINFHHLIDLDIPFLEPINERRGGWSGISMFEWAGQGYFVKRQKKHVYREVHRLFMRIPTLRREFRNIQRLKRIGIRVPEVVLYAENGLDSLLVIKALTGFEDLNDYLRKISDKLLRQQLFRNLASKLLKMHMSHMHYGSLYGKHVMVNIEDPSDIALIDLESLRYTLRREHNAAKDLSQLFRHTQGITNDEWTLVIEAYEKKFKNFGKRLAIQIETKQK